MPLSGIESEVAPLLNQFGAIVELGLVVSALGLFSIQLTSKLSDHSSVDLPDPTFFKRLFETVYDGIFDPVGVTISKEGASRKVRPISYHLGVGLAAIAFSLALYSVTAGLLVGAKYAAYQTGAFSVQVVPFFRSVIALVVLFTISVMSHSQIRAKEAISS